MVKRILDVGCGRSSIQRSKYEEWEYVGFDLHEPADIIGDMHDLPFKRQYFDKVISYAVMQYSQDVDKYLAEIKRVLKKGGCFEGTVAFVEPEHGELYHYSPRALQILLEKYFADVEIKPSKGWHGLTAIVCMNLFPGIGVTASKIITSPFLLMSKVYWMVGRIFKKNASEHNRRLRGAGSLHFYCMKN